MLDDAHNHGSVSRFPNLQARRTEPRAISAPCEPAASSRPARRATDRIPEFGPYTWPTPVGWFCVVVLGGLMLVLAL